MDAIVYMVEFTIEGCLCLFSVLTILIAIGTIIYKVKTNQNIVKQLSTKQKFGVILIFIITVAFATFCIYVGGNWLISFLQDGVIKTVLGYAIIIVVLIASIGGMYQAMHKITKGII